MPGAFGAGAKEEEMKHLKMLALAAVAVGALLAFLGAGSASASVICSTTADPCPEGQAWTTGTVVDWSIPSGSSVKMVTTAGETLDTCTESTIKKEITNTGSSTATVTAKVTATTFGGCTFTTDTLRLGKTEIHKISGTSNGTVTSDEPTEVTINTVLFGSCIYTVPTGKSVGDVSEGSGTNSVFALNAVTEKVSGSGFACPTTDRTTGTYVLTTPSQTTLSVSASGS